MAELAAEISEDLFLGGAIKLRQPGKGHRAGSDAVLLAAAAPAEFSGLALDIGAGVGAAGLALAALRPATRFGLVESDPEIARLAAENIELNGFSGRGLVYEADVLSNASLSRAGLTAGSARLVITNPPFLDPARNRLSTDRLRRTAHAMPDSGSYALAAWIAACLNLLDEGGLFVLIHKPEALTEILASVSRQAGAIALMPVQPRAGAPAVRILLRAKKGSGAPLSIAPTLVLHDEMGFQRHAEKIHRGEALIAW